MGFASDIYSARWASSAQTMAAMARHNDGRGDHDGSRGKFVEIIFSKVSRVAANLRRKWWARQGSNL